MTAADLERMLKRMGWSRRQAAIHLGITQDRLRRYLRREVSIPRLVELACMTLASGDDIGDWDWR
jgi:hypothetical protein